MNKKYIYNNIIIKKVCGEDRDRHWTPKVIVIGCAIMCSGAMALPVSSFPNANSYSIRVFLFFSIYLFNSFYLLFFIILFCIFICCYYLLLIYLLFLII